MNYQQTIKKHYHGNHDLVVNALKDVAQEIGVEYPFVKKDFIEGNQECTYLFWKNFYLKNPYKTMGVDYCRPCRKFILLFEEPRQPWSLLHDLQPATHV